MTVDVTTTDVTTAVRISVTIHGPAGTRYEVARSLDMSSEHRPEPREVLRAITHVSSQLMTVLRDHYGTEPEQETA